MRNVFQLWYLVAAAVGLASCGGSGVSSGPASGSVPAAPNARALANGSACPRIRPAPSQPGSLAAASGLKVPPGFTIQIVAHVSHARELAVLPNGDLLVGTLGSIIALVPHAQTTNALVVGHAFATLNDAPDNGVTFSQAHCTIYSGSQHGIYSIPYRNGDQVAESTTNIASVRTGEIAPNSDGDVHTTTSVAASDLEGLLYAGVGSSCNACVEVDPTRASIQQMALMGGPLTKRATRIRNAIALAVDPVTGRVWVGGAGQDDLRALHPYEFFDDLSARGGVPDYGWPDCEENHVAYTTGSHCANAVAPIVEFPAYTTLISAAFYPRDPLGRYTFPATYAGGIFVARHGSWHTPNGCTIAPEVDFIPMNGDNPVTPVDWGDPTKQWKPFVTGFQPGCSPSTHIGRPTGIAVGTDGSLFVADDLTDNIYRIRP